MTQGAAHTITDHYRPDASRLVVVTIHFDQFCSQEASEKDCLHHGAQSRLRSSFLLYYAGSD